MNDDDVKDQQNPDDNDQQNEGNKEETEQPESNWHYDPEEKLVNKAEDVTKADLKRNFTWKQAEFISHHKSQSWYLSFVGITIVVALITYLLMHDFLSVFIIVIVAIIFGVVAGRQPRELEYTVGSQGIKIQAAFRPYKDFKSFAFIDEGDLAEIVFLPLKRFSPPMTIYFDEDQAEDIVPIVAEHLPQDQEKGNDVVDRFIRNIRF